LTAKLRKADAGEIGRRMFSEYKEVTDLLVSSFGANRLVDDLAADDFEALRAQMAKAGGPVRLANGVTRVRSVFKYGTDNGLVERAVRFGPEFKKPDKAVLRRHRAKGGEKLFEAAQLRTLLDALDGKEVATGRTDETEKVQLDPNPQLRAMILLAINAGFGNRDCAALPLSAVSLDRGWLDFPRPKTGIPRRAPLWPETIAALRLVIEGRPTPKGFAEVGLVFLTPDGLAWVRHQQSARQKASNIDKVAVEFLKLTKRVGLHRQGLGFYSVRHTFRTVADATRDQPAADFIMGHTDPSMRGHYVERIEDERLKAVTDHVRRWLFGESGPSAG
jgi:integrase